MLTDRNLFDNLKSDFKEPKQVNYWQKLADCCEKMSADQQAFVYSHKTVLHAKAALMDAFSLFLFEAYKEAFRQSNDSFQKLCDAYIDSIINASGEYSTKIAQSIEENEQLKARVAELERKLNGN